MSNPSVGGEKADLSPNEKLRQRLENEQIRRKGRPGSISVPIDDIELAEVERFVQQLRKEGVAVTVLKYNLFIS